MLILSRRAGEKIVIIAEEDIKITVLKHDKDQYKIEIDAPKNIAVYREEVYERLKSEGKLDKKP